jgi:hypothetical protein
MPAAACDRAETKPVAKETAPHPTGLPELLRKEERNKMKNRRSWILNLALISGAVLALTLLTSDAKAGRGQSQLWPKGAQLKVSYYYEIVPPASVVWIVKVQWPAINVDHYRFTAAGRSIHGVRISESPATFVLDYATGTAQKEFFTPRDTVTITVTAYTTADETTAYSESLQTRITIK